jgi:Tol biopolymer transport system component
MDHTLQAGDGISHYRIVGALGTGGMGEVYLAQDLSLGRSVALKVLPPRLVRNEERLRRFVIEAKAASSLNHPSIVTIYEIGSGAIEREGGATDPVHFIAMERIDGHTLAELIHADKEDLRRLLGYLAQAADGIAKAHGAGIVHRDLKPSNIMVSRDGFAKVLDFGLAKLTESKSADEDASVAPTRTGEQTGAGTVMGTVGYMSPEQVQGKSVDHRSDIFSFGCILYEAVTRRRAFEADSAVDTMHKILHDAPVESHELNPKAPADLRRLVRRCLAKSADQRLQSMKDLAIELREIADGYDSLSNSASSGSGASAVGAAPRPAARRSWLIGGIVAASLVVVALAGAYVVSGRRASAGPGSVPGAPDMKMAVLMSRDDIREPVLSSDGRYLAYVISPEEKASLNVRQVRTGGDVRILSPQEFQIRGISFSPDGDYVYYLNQDPVSPSYSALFQVPSLGGAPRKVFFDVDTAATFSPDGSRLCFRRGKPDVKADTLVVGELATGTDRELVRIAAPVNFASAPAWAPDGKRVAVAVQTFDAGVRIQVWVVDVESGRRETVESKSFSNMDSLAWLPDGSALIVTAQSVGALVSQIYRLSYPGGVVRRLTNDLNGYDGLSLASAGRSIAAIRRINVGNVWVAPVDGGKEAHPLTFATGSSGSSREPLPLPGGNVVAAVLEGDRSVLSRVTDGDSERHRLVAQGLVSFGARYAEKVGIVFTQVSDKDFVPHLWRMDPDGGGLKQLTEGTGEILHDLSPDGGMALFFRTDDPTLLWSLNPATGGEPKQLASNTTGDPASISPDGKLVRYFDFTTVHERIYTRSVVIPSSGGAPVAQFVLPPGTTRTSWSPDGKSVTYVDRNKGWNLLRQPIAGGEPTELTHFTDGVTTEFEWSPDGERIAVVRRIGQKCGLWSVQPGKGDAKLLAEFRTGAITDPRFSPDSKSLVFVYGTSSRDVVLISDFQ